MIYEPETEWQVTENGKYVYNLKQEGWKNGEPIMENDVVIIVEARHLPEDIQKEISEVIKIALNDHFKMIRVDCVDDSD